MITVLLVVAYLGIGIVVARWKASLHTSAVSFDGFDAFMCWGVMLLWPGMLTLQAGSMFFDLSRWLFAPRFKR